MAELVKGDGIWKQMMQERRVNFALVLCCWLVRGRMDA